MFCLLGLIFLPSAFEIDQGLEKFQNPYSLSFFMKEILIKNKKYLD